MVKNYSKMTFPNDRPLGAAAGFHSLASPSPPAATANHDASTIPSTKSLHSNERENYSTRGVEDMAMSDLSEHATSLVMPSVVPLIADERQDLTKGSQPFLNQLGVQIIQTTQISPTLDPISIPTPYLTPEEQVARLWNAAYDQLMTENLETIFEYESVVSSYITTGRRPTFISRRSFIKPELRFTAQAYHRARKTLMDKCLNALLGEAIPIAPKDTTKDSDESAASGDSMRWESSGHTNEAGEVDGAVKSDARSLKDRLRKVAQESQHASLAWVATCLAMDVRYIFSISLFPVSQLQKLNISCLPTITLQQWLHPGFQPDAAQLGAIPIFAKMRWYIDLSKLLDPREAKENLDGNQLDISSSVGTLVRLYKAILWYHINIIRCHRGSVEKSLSRTEPIVDVSHIEIYQRDVETKDEEFTCFNG
jgi:hypothetical protein